MNWLKSIIYGDSQEVKDDNLTEYNNSLFLYETALKILQTKLNIIRSEYDREKVHSDIQNIKYRIKEVRSITKKLDKQGLEFNLENIQANLNDVVGARIVCLTQDDVYSIVDMIKKIPSIKVIQEKDYIKHPKESGYRSFHIIVEIEVPLANGEIVPINCEIQVRTLLMDAWSSLEHEIIYKNKECTEESKQRLKEYSYALASVERDMSLIRKRELASEDEEKSVRKITSKELKKFKEFLYIYEAAGMILESDISIVNSAYDREGVYSDIQSVKYRTKSIESIDRKLSDAELPFTFENVRNEIKDVIAARIICLDLDDLNRLVEMFKLYPGVNIVEDRNYVASPKESGYRARHLIIDIPVELADRIEVVRAEIQFRTVLMDAWAALEHETIYKNKNCSDESRQMLRDCSYTLSMMDRSMVDIKRTEMANLIYNTGAFEKRSAPDIKKKTKRK